MTHERSEPDAADVARLLLAAGRRPSPDAIRRDIARAAVHEAWRAHVRARTRRIWMAAAVPALAAAAALVFAVWPKPPAPAAPAIVARVATSTAAAHLRDGAAARAVFPGDGIAAGAAVETLPGVTATFTMDGGGELRQGGETAVRWIGARRLAVDRGRIYVDTGANATPVVVETKAGMVRDIGTRFEVDVRGDRVRVRVREGAVRLESPAGNRDAAAGRELVAGFDGAVEERSTPVAGAEWEWILAATPFRLQGSTLSRFVTWVEIEGGLRVEFRPAALRDETAATVLSGSIQGLSMTDAMAVVFPATGLAHRRDGDTVVVTRARER